MLDMRFIRENADLVKTALQKRNSKFDLDSVLRVDDDRRKVLGEVEALRARQNKANDEISALLKAKQDPKETIASMKEISRQINELEGQLALKEADLNKLLLTIPNVPHESVPVGAPDKAVIVRNWGTPRQFDFKPQSHVELCENLDIVDFARATKISGSNFLLFKGWGAKLERALFNFMLDLHTSRHGYTEIFPPYLVNRKTMTGTGQLPKMEEDMYRLKDEDMFLIPTAEVPVTNIYGDEILNEDDLPRYLTAYTACFRREAGSYGKDTRGMMRVHQFDKVEMVKFVKPENSYAELETLVNNAETVLQLLGLPYRVVALSSQDISFAAAKCYDLEAWAPGTDKWLEVSSCSNFEGFQARRANIRFRRKDTKKVEFVHTLNGSGVALARTVIAILENYQQKDGSIIIPEVLRRYLDGKETIS
ncbi:MAG TPA: serine--tRNA ligase [Candidatus Omnitrophota bacterium]|nr:serine--tRNA ligase [Candidatus Omnitrophota bacterium]HRZ15492.1 serine--tRNA ligase [Candidatus Omnitrophota bacterium]